MSCISENEISYALTCQRMKELKDLNEEGPKIAQRLFEVATFSFHYFEVSSLLLLSSKGGRDVAFKGV